MAVRKIEFTVSLDGIQPAVKQFAGVQGDHKATEIVFNIAPELYQSLTAQANNGAKLIYRFDGYDGEGGFKSSDTAELTESQLSYELEEWLTRFGGIVRAVLVISLLKDDLTQMELYSFPALLQLKNLPEGSEPDAEGYKSMSTLAQVAKDSANTAVNAKNIAVEAQNKTELARAALENGTVWVFDGGDAAGDVDLDGDGTPDMNTADIKFVVDGEMSDSSENAVKNKVIKAYVDENIEKISKADYIVEQGTSGDWTYRKWNSGTAECWFKGTIIIKLDREATNTNPWNLHIGSASVPTPIRFASTDQTVCTASCVWNYLEWVTADAMDVDTIQIRKFGNINSFTHNGVSPSDNHYQGVSIYVKGRWK